jgi:serine protease
MQGQQREEIFFMSPKPIQNPAGGAAESRTTAAVLLMIAAFSASACGGEVSDQSALDSDAPVGLTPYPLVVKPPTTHWGQGARRDLIVVKFAEGSRVRLRGGDLAIDAPRVTAADTQRLKRVGFTADRALGELSFLRSSIAAAGGGTARRLFTRSEADVEADRAFGERLSGQELPDLNLVYEIAVPAANAPALVDALNMSDLVELAYPAPLPAPHPAIDIAPATPSYVNNQGYLDGAPSGIDAKYAWTRSGGNGANVRIIDVEYSWNTQHEDLGAGGTNGPAVTLGFNGCDPTDKDKNGVLDGSLDHGTAVLGELVAARNAYGVTGIAYGSSYGISGVYGSGPPCSNYSPANAIYAAAASMNVGDIILIELQTSGPATCPQTSPPRCGWVTPPSPGVSAVCQDHYGYVPTEWSFGEYLAIWTATAAGRIVVEPAGNGEQDLDSAIYNGQFQIANRDSGAIMVGAGVLDSREPTCFSNFGSRVDVQGRGEFVRTLGYGDIKINGTDQNQWYSTRFSGTSSAAPIVAGAAAILQGVRKAAGQAPYTSSQMRSQLKLTGTPQPTPVTRRIGPQPNLRTALSPREPPATGYVASAQQTASMTTVFAIDATGSMATRTKSGTGAWQHALMPGSIVSAIFPPGAPIATGFRGTSQLDVFSVHGNGAIYSANSVNGGAWSTLAAIGGTNVAPLSAGLATGTRNTNQHHVFFVNNAGTLMSYSVTGTGTSWTGPTSIATNFAPPGAALATGRQGTTRLDVLAIGNNGALRVAWANDGGSWNAPVNLSAVNVAPPGGGVATGRRGADELDVFYVANGGIVNAVWVTGLGFWNGPVSLHPTWSGTPGAPISTANHGSGNNTLDVFFISTANGWVNRLRSIGLGSWSGPTAVANATDQNITSLSTSSAKRGTNLLDLFAIGSNGITVSTSTNAGTYSAFTELPP